jgi:chromosome segregation ATPase
MADDVLRYSDLIAPDNSIEDLIRLLDKVQDEYSALTQAARQYATNLQADMRRVNTATRAGRDELTRLTAQADTLDDVIRNLGDGYRLVERELAGMRVETPKAARNIETLTDQVQRYNDIIRGLRNMRDIFGGPMTQGLDRGFLRDLRELENVVNDAWPALNEYTKSIRETLLELKRVQEALDFNATGRATSDSLVNLEQALDRVIASYKALDAKELKGEIGGVTKNNLEVLRDAVTRLNAEIEPLVDKTTELIRAEQGLAVATSDEGKQAVAIKQKIAELNKETVLRATIVEKLSGSEKALKAQLELAKNEWRELGEPEQNSAAGLALQDRIKNLTVIIAEMEAKLKPAKAELTALEQAQKTLARATKALDAALTDEGRAAIAVKQEIAEVNKETRLQIKEAEAEEGAYDKLRAQLELAIAEWKKMGATERDTTAAGQALTDHIIDLSTQLKGLDNRLRAATESMSQDQIEMAMATDVAEKLAQAKAKVKIATSDEYKELMALSEEQREANRIAKLEATLKANSINSYNGMAAQYELNKIKLRKLALANRELTEDEKKLVAETYTLRAEMKKFQEMTGVHTLSVGEYGKVWDSFGFSIQQIVREMPAAAQGINNLFIAVANNIPIFVDELMKLRKENAAFIEQNQPDKVVSIGKRIAASLFSWQTALMALLTVLTMFGDDILKWVGSLFKGEAAVMSMKKAIRNLNKELENSNDSYGDNMASFKKLQNQWAALTTEAEKIEWIKNHEEAFEDLDLAINDVASAEQVLIKQADAVE